MQPEAVVLAAVVEDADWRIGGDAYRPGVYVFAKAEPSKARERHLYLGSVEEARGLRNVLTEWLALMGADEQEG